MPERRAPDRNHGVRSGVIAGVLGTLILVVVLACGAVHLLAKGWETPMAGANAPMDLRIPEPQLESAPQDDRARYVARKARLLDRYEWIDRENGIARIPIEVAMELMTRPVSADTARDQPSEGTAP